MRQEVTWRKSSYSDASGEGNCVEVAFTQQVLVRDSKNIAGPQLTFSAVAWRAFVSR